jgi:hypothetical protein
LEFKEFLVLNKEEIRRKWHQLIVETYPADSEAFLRKKKDRFANPVGYAISEMVDSVLGGLQDGADPERLSACLKPFVRMRAVQDFPPSRAVSFAFLLKKAVKEVYEEGSVGNAGALERLDSIVEEMALVSFDIYTECREAINRVKEDEMKRNLYMLLRKANLLDSREESHG